MAGMTGTSSRPIRRAGSLLKGAVTLVGASALVGAMALVSTPAVASTPPGSTVASAAAINGPNALSTTLKRLANPSPGENAEFGRSVAISGTTAVIGSSAGNGGDGEAYVYVRTSGKWTLQASLIPSDPAFLAFFGLSVGISGNIIVVGAYGLNDSGAAYVFTRSGTTWTQQAELTDTTANGSFGWSVAVSGTTVVVGQQGNDDITGAVYVFTQSGTNWPLQKELKANNGGPNQFFGDAVAVDDNTVVVGAPYVNNEVGAAYVFVRNAKTLKWSQQTELMGADADPSDFFGGSVSVAGNIALVGAPGHNNDDGAAYIFTRTGTSWAELPDDLIANDAAPDDYFGTSVALNGTTALIGATGNDANDGAAYVFTQSSPAWTQQTELNPLDNGGNPDFGDAVALTPTAVVVGADGFDDDSGLAYIS